MRISDDMLDQIAAWVEAGPDWTPSPDDGMVEPQASISRRQAEDLIADLRDLRAAVTSLMQDASPEHWRRLRDLMGVDDEGIKKEGR
jgi:hypothetical protein